MERVYVNGEHSSVLMKSMAKLWKERKYCDAVLDVNSENIELHKLVLLAASPSIINKVNRITDRGTIVIKLEGKCYNKDAAKLCVQYLYKGIAKLTDSNVKSVAKIAEVLELKEILKICASFQDTFKLVKEETSESEVDYGSDTEEETAHDDTAQISENLTVALEEALDNIKHIEERSDKGDPATGTVKMEISMESCLVEASKRKQKQKPEEELETAIESIKDKDDTVDTSQLHPEIDTEDTKFQTMKQLQAKQEPDIVVECPRCDQKILSRNLMTHIKQVHIAGKKFTCSICGKIYSSKQAKDNHKQSLHTRQCQNCSRYVVEVIPWEKGIDRRSKRHILCKCGAKVTICTKVGRSKESQHSSGEHQKQSHEKYACVTCGKLFSTKTHCQRHSMTHNDDKVFSCNKCDYRTSQQSSLKEHELEEHRKKSLVCCYCGKKFSKLKTLKSHLVNRHSTDSGDK